MCICTLYVMCPFFPLLAHFHSFSLLLDFSSFLMIQADMVFFVYSVWGSLGLWVCGFIVFIRFKTTLTIISSNIHLSLFFKYTYFFKYISLPFSSQIACYLVGNWGSVQFPHAYPSVQIVSFALSSSWLMFSPIVSNCC